MFGRGNVLHHYHFCSGCFNGKDPHHRDLKEKEIKVLVNRMQKGLAAPFCCALEQGGFSNHGNKLGSGWDVVDELGTCNGTEVDTIKKRDS